MSDWTLRADPFRLTDSRLCARCCYFRTGEYLDLLEHKRAGKCYLKDWHFVHAFSQEELYTYGICTDGDRLLPLPLR